MERETGRIRSTGAPTSRASHIEEVSVDDDFIYYLHRGSELLRHGQAQEARAAVETAYTLAPDNPKAQNLLGLVYFKLGLLEAAKAIYDRLLATFPEEAALFVNLGLVLIRQGRLEEAERALRDALAIEPDHHRAHCYLALVLYRRGDLKAASEHFARGEAHDLARKVAAKAVEDPAPPSAQAELLQQIAADGMADLQERAEPFVPLDDVREESLRRDEEAWEATVTHSRAPRPGSGIGSGSLLGMWASELGPATTLPPLPPPPLAGQDSDIGTFLPPVQAERRRDPFADLPTIPRSLETATPAEPVPPRPDPSGELELPESLLYGSARPAPASPVSGGMQQLPSLTPQMPRGFHAGPGARARLVMDERAYLRASTIVAASGALGMREAMNQLQGRGTGGVFGGTDDPMCVIDGRGLLMLRVPRMAVALRGVRDLHVVESALMGFDEGFTWDNGKILGIETVTLRGRGSLLFDTRGPPVLIPVETEAPVHAALQGLLAWSDSVRPSPVEGGVGKARLFRFRGRGFVLVAFPPDENVDLG